MPAELVNLNRAKAIAFPFLTDSSQDNTVQTLVNAASRAAESWCKRIFGVTNYDEIIDSEGNGSVTLRGFPVLAVTRVAINPTTVLTIRNTDMSNSRAFVATEQVAQQEVPTPTTGIRLTRVAGGLTVIDVRLLWNQYTTVQALADAINTSYGSLGWTATVEGSYGNWASNDITPLQGAQSALATNAHLRAHTTDVNDYDILAEAGELRFSGGLSNLFGTGWLPGGFAGTYDIYPGVSLPRGGRNLRVQYTAGFNQIPDAVQEAVALWAVYLYKLPQFAGSIISETLADYSYTRALLPPNEVYELLKPFKDHKI